MFIFIVPLRSRQTCSDWGRVSLLCNQTLQSLIQQNSNKYRVILVCNEPPLDFVEHDNVNVVRESFSIPKSWNEGIGDIYQKVKRGMVEVKRLQLITPSSRAFVMRVDADDLVSNQIVSFAEKYPDSDGWYFPTGYIYEIGKNYLFLRPKFTAISGTSNILNCTYTDFPESMDIPPTEWLEPVWQHLNINELLEPRGRKLNSLPFPGAVYRINPQNMSATHVEDARFSSIKSVVWKFFFKRKLTKKIIGEFAFPCVESL